MMAGDAGSFLDPVFSSGVAIAMESGLEAARAIDAGLAAGDLTARVFRRLRPAAAPPVRGVPAVRPRVLHPGFRDLFFSPDPPRRMFTAIITVLAGYWRPSWKARVWLWLFFLTVRLQSRLEFAPSHLQPVADPSRPPAPIRSPDEGGPGPG